MESECALISGLQNLLNCMYLMKLFNAGKTGFVQVIVLHIEKNKYLCYYVQNEIVSIKHPTTR